MEELWGELGNAGVRVPSESFSEEAGQGMGGRGCRLRGMAHFPSLVEYGTCFCGHLVVADPGMGVGVSPGLYDGYECCHGLAEPRVANQGLDPSAGCC